MADSEDVKLAAFVRDCLPTVRGQLAPLRVIAFGSRVRGDALCDSDLDLVLVSPWFSRLRFLERAPAVLELLDYPAGLELLCYTPEEFEQKRHEMGVVRVAVEEGVTL
jgi:predicted nucleotidyltransferase